MFLAANQAAAALDCADYQRPAPVVMVAVQGAEVLLHYWRFLAPGRVMDGCLWIEAPDMSNKTKLNNSKFKKGL